jgi:hypothetical protein
MKDLALAGFMPIAIVYCEPGNAGCYFLYERNDVSHPVHQQLVTEAEAILEAAAECTECKVNAFPRERVKALASPSMSEVEDE